MTYDLNAPKKIFGTLFSIASFVVVHGIDRDLVCSVTACRGNNNYEKIPSYSATLNDGQHYQLDHCVKVSRIQSHSKIFNISLHITYCLYFTTSS